MSKKVQAGGAPRINNCPMRRLLVGVMSIACSLAAADVLLPVLPTGKRLDAAGRSIAVGNMPLSMVASPDGSHLIVLLSGWRDQGIQVVDVASGRVDQFVPLPSSFLGLAFSPDGETLYASGANDDVIHLFAWRANQLTPQRDISLKRKADDAPGSHYPASIAVSADGKRLYVAENIGDALDVIDTASGTVMQRFPTGHYPYGVAVAPDGAVYVSAWAANIISVFRPQHGELVAGGAIEVGRHPSALLFNRSGSRLYATLGGLDKIAVIDPKRKRVLHYIDDASPNGPREGSTPNALALSADQSLLYVAEADNNAVAVFKLTSGSASLVGRIPVDWYPTALLATPDRLFVLNAKGGGTHPNPKARTPADKLEDREPTYVLSLIEGTIRVVDLPPANLAELTRRVTRANNWAPQRDHRVYPPFKHVLYIIKENRTYDQVLGDMSIGDGDPSLIFFPRAVSANHHALAERFGLYDRFFTNAEVSSQGHMWSTSGYVTDYMEKVVQSMYASKRPAPDWEGEAEDAAEGYLWTRAAEQGISMRNYGEFAAINPDKSGGKAMKPMLAQFTSAKYPPYDLSIPDQKRADVFIEEFNDYVRNDNLPKLMLMHLPNDHTAGGRAGRRTPRAYFADNDLALGRIVEAISKSRYWRDTVIFVVEDDSQDGPDHVDSHRSVMFAISAYNRPGVVHRFVNTTDVLATIEQIIGMRPFSQFDVYSRPLAGLFASEADLRPYEALKPEVSLEEMNPATAPAAKPSASLDLSKPDIIDDDLFNRVLWLAIKGESIPYPGRRRAVPLQLLETP